MMMEAQKGAGARGLVMRYVRRMVETGGMP